MTLRSTTKVDVSTLDVTKVPEGWQMDILIATVIFGYNVQQQGTRRIAVIDDTDNSPRWLRDYSTNPQDTLVLINKVLNDFPRFHWEVKFTNEKVIAYIEDTSNVFSMYDVPNTMGRSEASTFTMAVCRAALELAKLEIDGE